MLHLLVAAAARSRSRNAHNASTLARAMRATRPFSAALGWGSGKGGSQRPGGGDPSRRRNNNNNEGGGGGGGERSERTARPPPRTPATPYPRRDNAAPPPPPPRPRTSPQPRKSSFYDHTGRFFATCHPGLEPFVADELRQPAVGASAVEPGRGGVHFRGSAATCYAANLWLRTAIRVLHLVGEGSIAPSRYRGGNGGGNGSGGGSFYGGGGRAGGRSERGGDRLYALTRRAVDWASLLPSSPSNPSSPGTIAVDARVGACTDLAGSRLAATIVRDAVCDAVRDATGRRPPPPQASSSSSSSFSPSSSVDLPIFVAAHRDVVWLYRDTSGDSLHRRGYRTGSKVHAAALNEAAAAGVLAAAGWPARVAAAEAGFLSSSSSSSAPFVTLVDPMCGSGTLLIEAALAATHTAPGLSRTKWPFLRWGDFDPGLWRSVRERAAAASRRDGVTMAGAGSRGKRLFRLAGRDCHEGALALAQRGAFEAGVDHLIDFDLGKCADWRPSFFDDDDSGTPLRPSLVVTNPPWGRRLMGARDRFDAPAFAPRTTRGGGRGGGDDDDGGRVLGRRPRAEVEDDGESRRPWYDVAADEGDELGWDDDSSPAAGLGGGEGGGDRDDDPERSEEALAAAWRDLGSFLREAASPGEAVVVCGNPEASRGLRMRASRKWPLTAGGADVRILHYDVLPPLEGAGAAAAKAAKAKAASAPGRKHPLENV